MDIVRVEDFPSDTNWSNFQYDINTVLPGLPYEIDHGKQAMLIQLQYYEAEREQITEFAKRAGAVVFHEVQEE